MAEKTQYPLTKPIERKVKVDNVDGIEVITHVPYFKLKPKDMRVTDFHEGDVAKSIAAIAHMTGLTINEVDNMEMEDFNALGPLSQGNTPAGPTTGESV